MPPSTTPITWRARIIGRDRALVGSTAGVTMAFALGPATGEVHPKARLSAVASDAATGVRSLAFCRQVHGAAVHVVEQAARPAVDLGEGDALVTTTTGLGVVVWTADCVPVLLAGEGVVAAVHAGWRGCAADVVGVVVSEIQSTSGLPPQRLRAALGPSVCGTCYQVGSEVPEALRRFDLDRSRWLDGDRVDLRSFLIARLVSLGLPADHIESVGGCTLESPELASFRRDGHIAGRQWSMAFLDV